MSKTSAEFVKPFLEQCGMFKEIQIVDWQQFMQVRPQLPACVDLDGFRTKKINFMAGDIRQWYYSLSNYHFKRDFSEDLFKGKFVGDERAKDKVLVCYTDWYSNYFINIALPLSEHKKDVAFIGLDNEYERIKRLLDYDVPRFELKNLADAAYLMKSSRGVIGNQGGLYSLAEMLKVPRVLLPVEYMKFNEQLIGGPCNVHPVGGECDMIQTIEQALHIPDFLFEKK